MCRSCAPETAPDAEAWPQEGLQTLTVKSVSMLDGQTFV